MNNILCKNKSCAVEVIKIDNAIILNLYRKEVINNFVKNNLDSIATEISSFSFFIIYIKYDSNVLRIIRFLNTIDKNKRITLNIFCIKIEKILL